MTLQVQQLLLCLGTAHVLGDFLLQSKRVALGKHRLGVLLWHALTVMVLSYLLCGAWRSWLIPAAVFAVHALIDAVKARAPRQNLTSFLLDQAAHAVSIVVIAFAVAEPGLDLSWVRLFGDLYLEALVVVAGLVVGLWAGAIVISLAVEPLLQELEQSASAGPPAAGRGLEHGGRWIGLLERALIFLFVLSGQPASIGFLIAAKSIFRFGELKESHHRMEAEYIIIGTMMSFGFGLLAAYATRFLLGLSWT